MSDLLDRYLAIWNEPSPAARRALLEQHWSADVRFVDPLVDVHGHDGVEAVITGVRAQFDGLVFSAVDTAETHHDVTRFRWGLGPAGEEPLVIGFDVVTTDAEGKFATVVGFLDRVPEGAA